MAEFVVCVLVLALSPLSRADGQTSAGKWMRQATALSGMFVFLGLVSAAGPRAAKTAAAFGGLATVVLLVDQHGAFATMASLMKGEGPAAKVSGPPDQESEGPEDVEAMRT